jgi:hypothetical protein
MNNVILKNIFTEEQINSLYAILKEKENDIKIDEPQLGRTRYDIDKNLLDPSIVKRINELAQNFNKNLRFGGCYYSEYSLKYGKPELSIHTDQTVAVFTIDYQLDANIDWEVYVEGISFLLKNNEAVTINVNSQAHWRPQRIFSDAEYVKMIYFHFLDRTKPKPKILTREEMKDMQEKYYHLWRKK